MASENLDGLVTNISVKVDNSSMNKALDEILSNVQSLGSRIEAIGSQVGQGFGKEFVDSVQANIKQIAQTQQALGELMIDSLIKVEESMTKSTRQAVRERVDIYTQGYQDQEKAYNTWLKSHNETNWSDKNNWYNKMVQNGQGDVQAYLAQKEQQTQIEKAVANEQRAIIEDTRKSFESAEKQKTKLLSEEAKDRVKAEKQSMKEMEKASKEAAKMVQQQWSGAFGHIMNTMNRVFSAYTMKRVFDQFMKETVTHYTGEQKLQNATATVQPDSLRAQTVNFERLQAMAKELEKTTTFADHQIMEVMARATLQFRNLNGQIFDRTIQSALDLATVMKVDLTQAIRIVGTAMNDPKLGLTRLTRIGVTLPTNIKEQIKNLMKKGDVEAAQQILAKQLEALFKGAAQSAAETLPGALQKLKINIQNLFTFDEIDTSRLMESIKSLSSYLTSPAMKEAVSTLGETLVTTAERLLRLLTKIQTPLSWCIAHFEILVGLWYSLKAVTWVVQIVSMAKLAGSISQASAAAMAMSGATSTLGVSMASLAGPIGIVLAGFAAITIAFGVYQAQISKIKQEAVEFSEGKTKGELQVEINKLEKSMGTLKSKKEKEFNTPETYMYGTSSGQISEIDTQIRNQKIRMEQLQAMQKFAPKVMPKEMSAQEIADAGKKLKQEYADMYGSDADAQKAAKKQAQALSKAFKTEMSRMNKEISWSISTEDITNQIEQLQQKQSQYKKGTTEELAIREAINKAYERLNKLQKYHVDIQEKINVNAIEEETRQRTAITETANLWKQAYEIGAASQKQYYDQADASLARLIEKDLELEQGSIKAGTAISVLKENFMDSRMKEGTRSFGSSFASEIENELLLPVQRSLSQLQQQYENGVISYEQYMAKLASGKTQWAENATAVKLYSDAVKTAQTTQQNFTETWTSQFNTSMGEVQKTLWGLGDSFAGIVGQVLSGTQSIGDALKSLGQQILAVAWKAFFWQVIMKSIMTMFGGWFGGGVASQASTSIARMYTSSMSTTGNFAFANGGIFPSHKFASGGLFGDGKLISSTMNVPMATMGEAGDEMVAPVTRMSNGAVGLSVAGLSQRENGSNIVTNINVNNAGNGDMTNDQAKSFGKQMQSVVDMAVARSIYKQQRMPQAQMSR